MRPYLNSVSWQPLDLASRLLSTPFVQASTIIAAAQEMFQAQQYTGVASLCSEALEVEPENLELRILRARALLALRCDEEARDELGRILRSHSETAEVFHMLGELAIRRSKLEAAETFLKQALRLEPGDRRVEALLELVKESNQPTVAVEKLPAATATVGCTRLDFADSASDYAFVGDDDSVGEDIVPRFARGTHPIPPLAPAALFGHYLVDIGVLTPVQLRHALDYHRRSGVRVGDAAVALGFLSEDAVEGAARAYHAGRNNL